MLPGGRKRLWQVPTEVYSGHGGLFGGLILAQVRCYGQINNWRSIRSRPNSRWREWTLCCRSRHKVSQRGSAKLLLKPEHFATMERQRYILPKIARPQRLLCSQCNREKWEDATGEWTFVRGHSMWVICGCVLVHLQMLSAVYSEMCHMYLQFCLYKCKS